MLTALIMPMSIAWAHEIRPAYLQIDEIGLGRYQLLWRTPVFSGMRLPVVLRLPDEIHQITAPAVQGTLRFTGRAPPRRRRAPGTGWEAP